MAITKIKIAIVEWTDACSKDYWHDKEHLLGPATIVTVGIVVHEPTKQKPFLTIRRSEDHPGHPTDGSQDGSFCIPANAIVKYKPMEVNMAAHPRKPKKSRRKKSMKKRQPRKKGGRKR